MKYQEKHKAILGELENVLHKGHSSYVVFEDWLDLMLFALMGEEEEYMKVVKKYANQGAIGVREIDCFANAFGLLLKQMKLSNEELLGQLYQAWNIQNKYSGQFFTPKNIASMMAQIIQPKGRILEPCCGAGIMLVEAIKTMSQEDLDSSVFYGQDIDLTCVKMCALNLLFFNVNGYVIWGDTLKMEVKRVYQTHRSYLGGTIRILSDADTEAFSKEYRQALIKANVPETFNESNGSDTNVTDIAKQQLRLF